VQATIVPAKDGDDRHQRRIRVEREQDDRDRRSLEGEEHRDVEDEPHERGDRQRRLLSGRKPPWKDQRPPPIDPPRRVGDHD
jgi:hypothetical protein